MSERPDPKFSWFVPIDGDGDRIGSLRAQRKPTFAYLRDVVLNAERLGYHSLLIPTRVRQRVLRALRPARRDLDHRLGAVRSLRRGFGC